MQLVSKEKAASLLGSGDTLVISGSGGGHAVPDALLEALGNRFAATGEPRAITAVHTVGIGDHHITGADDDPADSDRLPDDPGAVLERARRRGAAGKDREP